MRKNPAERRKIRLLLSGLSEKIAPSAAILCKAAKLYKYSKKT